MQPAKISIEGIKCDNPKCDFNDTSVTFDAYRDWLNKPCPKCGAVLLTEKDLKAVKRLMATTHFLNLLLKPFVKINRDTKCTRIPVEMDGTGRMTFHWPQDQ